MVGDAGECRASRTLSRWEALSLEGSLPLGMLERPEFSLLRFELQPADRLMLLSDGIAEATDADGESFRFRTGAGLLPNDYVARRRSRTRLRHSGNRTISA